jgi:Holliday junction resolvase RusA-like endonuclease
MMFFAPGQPIGKGRPRFGKGRTYTPARTVNYEKYVAAIASDRMQELKQAPTTGPCSVHIVARMEIPKSWPKKKQAQAENHEISPGKPDLDNIAKTVLDALNGICYEDDAQVVILSVTKCYSCEPGVMVRVD